MTPAPGAPSPHLVTVSGQDAPGIARSLFTALASEQVEVEDVEQVRVHGRLLLCVEVRLRAKAVARMRAVLGDALREVGVEVGV